MDKKPRAKPTGRSVSRQNIAEIRRKRAAATAKKKPDDVSHKEHLFTPANDSI